MKTATCQHNRPWWDDDCPGCKAQHDDALIVVDRSPNFYPVAETWRVRGEPPLRTFWREDLRIARSFLECLSARMREFREPYWQPHQFGEATHRNGEKTAMVAWTYEGHISTSAPGFIVKIFDEEEA